MSGITEDRVERIGIMHARKNPGAVRTYAATTPGALAKLPMMDRREILADAIAICAGSRAEFRHPIAEAVAQDLTAGRFAETLGIQVRAMLTSADVRETIADAVRVLVLDVQKRRGTPEHRVLVNRVTVPDFRVNAVPRMAPMTMQPVNELGEIEAVQPEIGWAGLSVQTRAAVALFSRQALIDGRWDVLATITAELIDAAERAERADVFAALAANPVLDDGLEVFHADRGNIVTNETLGTVGMLRAMFKALKGMSVIPATLAGPTPLNIGPAVLAMPAGDEVTASILDLAGNLNLTLVSDASLVDWYLLPAPSLRPVIALAHLDDRGAPLIDTKRLFDQEGIGVRGRHDFGVAVVSPYAVRASAPA